MATRIRRNRPLNTTSAIDALMKSISEAQERIAEAEAILKTDIPALHALMRARGMEMHRVDDIIAELYQSAGRASNIIDPKGFRKLVPDDADFYSAVSVSVVKARELLPKKQLDSITTNVPGKPGEETVRVMKWTAKK